ncbi:MAG: hypothetical protein H0W36_02600 [Gemmatimonadetes bacterium]|nr:hypothetical protein [Gemmatimonadota bacterium]
MDHRTATEILQRLAKLERETVRYRQGVVTDDSPLSVALGGSTVAYEDVSTIAAHLEAGDTVGALAFANDLLVLGHLGGVTPPLVTSLPASPADGREVYYQSAAMAALGIVWHLRYRSGATGSYKWEYLGGGTLSDTVNVDETTTSTSFADLATTGPSVVIPLAGDYLFTVSAQVIAPLGNFGAASAYGDDEGAMSDGNTTASHPFLKTVASASTVTLKYRVSGGTGTFLRRVITATPVRVG